MNTWAAALDTEFLESFVASLRPLDTDQEERMIAALANHTKLSPDFLRSRMSAYLRGRVAEIRGKVHPGNGAIH
jgi:hypothetical protein